MGLTAQNWPFRALNWLLQEPAHFPKRDPSIPTSQRQLSDTVNNTKSQRGWLKKVKDCVDPIDVTYAGYHAEVSIKESKPITITALLPILHHSAYTVTMESTTDPSTTL